MTTIVFFDETARGIGSLVGGKGSNLIALSAAKFPVPPGFVVTADAYQKFLREVPHLDGEVAAFNYDDPDHLRDQCDRLRARLVQCRLPDELERAIHDALNRLGAKPDDAFAVRSSSTFEDLAQAAFAGQHDTYLNIRGGDAIVAAVRDCFVSLWADRAVLYRHHQGFAQTAARMAVVVQRQIACDVAGVGFSIHPVSGNLEQIVIDANYGLGESVVAGECEVDHFELDKQSLAVTSRLIGHKDRMIAPTRTGVEERTVPADQSDRPCLDDSQLAEVANLVKRVEAHYGWPQDIEWGWHAGQLYQFQSRPVTTIQPRWTRDESAERFPKPMTPLCWDYISTAFRRSLVHSLDLMGLPPLEGDWFQVFDHYVYGNQNAVTLIAAHRPLRARNVTELVAELPDLRQRYAWVSDLPVAWARDLDRYLLQLGRLSAVDLREATLPEIHAHMNELLTMAGDYFLPNIAISMTQGFLHRLLHGLITLVVGPERALEFIDGLLAGCETKTSVVNRELHDLAQIAAGNERLKAELIASPGEQLWHDRWIEGYPDFRARFARLLEDHGHREMDMDYSRPTWSAQPGIVLDALRLIINSGAADRPDESAHEQRSKYADAELRFLLVVPVELRFFFRELIRLTRIYTTLDDLEHYQTTRLNPVARQVGLAMGERLRERGILDSADEIFFLHKSDLDELVAAYPREDKQKYRQRAAAARKSFLEQCDHSPPWTLAESTEAPAADGKTLRGLPGGPGRVTGPCFCVHEPSDFARFPKGAVLVARTTNPAWTPLFYSAVGLITESGGPLSHGAVTAREMRLPAVMSVRGVMSLLADGQVVTVDGAQGIVQLE